jgi:hypothetical protein
MVVLTAKTKVSLNLKPGECRERRRNRTDRG